MSAELEMNGRTYRVVELADRWAKSQFEYFHEDRNEWRKVRNWNTRERLFNFFQ